MKGLVLIVLFFVPFAIFAATISNAGFLQGGIWYSKDPFFAGETVRVYAAIFNSGLDDISGRVEFFDNQKSIGSSNFFVERGGRFSQVWTDWQATEGNHSIKAVIVSALLLPVGKEPIPIEFEQKSASEESPRLVQKDSDGDRVGNNDDPDDDNDGLTDTEEIKLGTNPLIADSPQLVKQKTEQPTINQSEEKVADETISDLAQKTKEQFSISNDTIKETLEPAIELVDKKRDEIRKYLRELAQNPEAGQGEKVLEYSYLASLAILSFILKNQILLYIISIIAGYFILKMILRRLFRRNRNDN